MTETPDPMCGQLDVSWSTVFINISNSLADEEDKWALGIYVLAGIEFTFEFYWREQ